MIKLILFSCVTLTLINFSLCLELDQSINGDELNNYVQQQQLRLRLKRSAPKTLLGSQSSSTATSMASAGSSAIVNDGQAGGGSNGKGGLAGLVGLTGLDGLVKEGLIPDKLVSMTLGQMAQLVNNGQGEASLNSIIEYLKKVVNQIGSGQSLLNSDLMPGKTIKTLLNSGSGSGSGSGITKMLSNFANPSSLSSSAGASSATATSSVSN